MKNRLELIKKSAAGGNLKAMTELGVIYFTSSYGSEPNYAKAFQLFNEAANKGHGRTFGELASLYCHGIYVEKDRKKEVELLEKACIAGDTQSVILLARMYIRGVGVEIDRKKAIEIYERAFLGKKGWRIESELANEYLSLNVAGLYDDERAFRFLYDYKNKESCKRKVEIRRKLEKMLIMREVEWTVDYHCWWLYYLKDVKKIVLLLSISKFRGESFGNKIENRGVLIKGLVMKYIKYFFQSAAICCY